MAGIRRFFAEQIPPKDEQVMLSSEVSHHLLRVVGIAPNEEVELFDGNGHSCRGKLVGVKEGCALIAVNSVVQYKELRREIHLFQGLLRQQPFSTALRMSTELGVTHIHPILCNRSVARGEKLLRWRKIVASSAAQSGRSDCPRLYDLSSFEQACGLVKHCHRWVLHPSAEDMMRPEADGAVAVFVGPEGGLTDAEVELALSSGWLLARFSGGVLRADTAAAAALAQFLR